ncbi:hypothetical protein JA1_004190 [Spathaspora sp. JA1]|nr:hypothetical protein JA1_004190 [Spathaspora sp. JA1]
MAVTRSQDKAKKIVFEDNDEDEQELTAQDHVNTKQSEDEDSELESEEDEDSDDEAPEEESTRKTEQDILNQQKKKEQQVIAEKKAERERRRQLDLRNQQQKQQSKKVQSLEEQALPDLLPDDIMDILSTPEPQTPQSKIKGKHIRLDDVEVDRKKEIEDKLRKIKLQKKLAVKKGPVHVQVHNFGNKATVVPKSESKIIASKDKWLKRKSVNRK